MVVGHVWNQETGRTRVLSLRVEQRRDCGRMGFLLLFFALFVVYFFDGGSKSLKFKFFSALDLLVRLLPNLKNIFLFALVFLFCLKRTFLCGGRTRPQV